MDIPHSRPLLGPADRAALEANLATGRVARGEEFRRFEAGVAALVGGAGAVAMGSGTAAVALALKAAGVEAGDEVILPTYLCSSVLRATRLMGARPVLCDCAPDSWVLSAETVRPHVSARTRAILAVHTFGTRAPVESLREFGVPIIEDAAQSLGLPGVQGTTEVSGDWMVCSFAGTKCLTTGEGGMVVAADAALLDRVKAVAALGPADLSPLSDLAASLGNAQLERYPKWLKRRREIAERYSQELPGELTALTRSHADRTVYFRYLLDLTFDFEQVRAAFGQREVQVRRGVDALLHAQPGRFPQAERRFARTLSIPIYPGLRDEEVARVIAATHEVLAHYNAGYSA